MSDELELESWKRELKELWERIWSLPIDSKKGIVAAIMFIIITLGINTTNLAFNLHHFIRNYFLDIEKDITTYVFFYILWLPAIFSVIAYRKIKNQKFYFYMGYIIGLIVYRINNIEDGWRFPNNWDYSIRTLASCLVIAITSGLISCGINKFLTYNKSQN